MSGPNPSSRAWDSLNPPLSGWMLEAMSSMGLARMTPVQACTIPMFMAHKDVVVEAVTGSGKTLAFLIPVIERLLRLEAPIKKHHIGGIILSPTRELATQIYKVLESLLEFHPPSAEHRQTLGERENPSQFNEENGDESASSTKKDKRKSSLKVVPQLLVGGSKTPAQDLSTFLKRSPNLIVSTPGRLLELLSSPHVHCPQSSFEVLVLDEADRLLDLGFKEDLQKILVRLPKQRRTGLFSASVSEAVDQIIHVGLRNPVKIAVKVKGTSGVDDKRTPASLQMTYLVTKPSHKLPAAGKVLSSMDPTPQKTIIYFSTCAAVDYFQHVVPTILPRRLDLTVVPLHGKHPPNVRQKNFNKFVNSVTPSVLLTTDVAARGLDIPQVDLVMQFDPPTDPKAFLHRCGRAGRAGRRGLSVVFLTPGREEEYVGYMDVRRTPITPYTPPPSYAQGAITVNDDEATSATRKIRKLVFADRALHDKGQRAFVSWVRSYTKHQASSIFRVADQDWDDLGSAWGLLKLPKMPETKKWTGDTYLGLRDSIDWSTYAYKDKAREKQRQEKLKAEAEAAANGETKETKEKENTKKRPASSIPWSEQHERKETKSKKKERKRLKKEHERWDKMSEEEKARIRETEEMIKRMREENARKKAENKAGAVTVDKDAAKDEDDTFEGFDD